VIIILLSSALGYFFSFTNIIAIKKYLTILLKYDHFTLLFSYVLMIFTLLFDTLNESNKEAA